MRSYKTPAETGSLLQQHLGNSLSQSPTKVYGTLACQIKSQIYAPQFLVHVVFSFARK